MLVCSYLALAATKGQVTDVLYMYLCVRQRVHVMTVALLYFTNAHFIDVFLLQVLS